MKRVLIALAAGIIAAGVRGQEAALADAQASFEQTATEGAARIVLRQHAEKLLAEGPAEGFLKGAMLGAPEENAKAGDSRKWCAEAYRKDLEARWREGASNVLARLAAGTNVRARVSAGFAERAMTPPAERVAEAVERAMEASWGKERAAAIEEQSRAIIAAVRPTEWEVENVRDGELAEKLTRRIVESQKRAVFEENVEWVSAKIVRPMLDSARVERGRQRDYLARARADSWAPGAMAGELRLRLRENLEARGKKAGKGEYAWREFPSVTNAALAEAVERRVTRRLANYAAETAVEATPEMVAEVMRKDPAGHAKKGASMEALGRIFGGRIVSAARAEYVGDAPEAEREELGAYLAGMVEKVPANVAKAAAMRVKKDFTAVFEKGREEYAKREFAETWPELSGGEWLPEAGHADRTAARSDYAKAVKEWRSDLELAGLAGAARGKTLAEETEAAADAAVSRGFETARSAIAAQNGEAEKAYAKVREEAFAEKAAWFGKAPDLRTVAARLRERTEEGWGARRVAVLWPEGSVRPEDTTKQYAGLFPSVERKIEVLAKSIMEQLEKQEQKVVATPVEAESEEEEEQVFECTIELRREGERVGVKVKDGERVVFGRECGATVGELEGVMREAARVAGRELLKIK